MSVAVYMENSDLSAFESEFCIPIASERFFAMYWQKAIEELSVRRIQNGISLKKEGLKDAVIELAKLREWALSNPELQKNRREQEYMVNRIDSLTLQLPIVFSKKPDAVLWIG